MKVLTKNVTLHMSTFWSVILSAFIYTTGLDYKALSRFCEYDVKNYVPLSTAGRRAQILYLHYLATPHALSFLPPIHYYICSPDPSPTHLYEGGLSISFSAALAMQPLK